MALNNDVMSFDKGVESAAGDDFEDVGVTNDGSGGDFPPSSPVSSLSVAVAIERDRRQRKILVDNMVRFLVDTLDNQKFKTKDTSLAADANAAAAVFEVIPSSDEGSSAANVASGSETTATTKGPVDRASQHASIVQHVLGEEFGSTTMTALSFTKTSSSSKTSTQWNKGQPLALHWVWQASLDGDGTIEYSTCNLSILAKEGVAIDFYAKASAPTSVEQGTESELGADPLQYQDELEKIATCEIPKFQWTLEGNTKKAGDGEEEIFEDIQSFWKLESAIYNLTLGSIGDIITEEVLLEISDISLIGRVAHSNNSAGEDLRLQPKSVLSLKASSNEDIGGSDEKKRKVGQALRFLVSYLDELLYVPEVQLFLKNLNSPSSDEGEAIPIPSFEQEGDSMGLGGTLKYYLQHYCNNAKKRSKLSTKFLSIGDSVTTSGAMLLTGASFVTPIGGLVSVAALAAKDGVAAAAQKGKEARIAAKTATVEYKEKIGEKTRGIRDKSKEASEKAKTATAEYKYKLGEKTRGVTESIRDKSKEASEKAKTATAEYKYKFGDATRGVTESLREIAEKGKEARIKGRTPVLKNADIGEAIGATIASGGNECTNRISMEFSEAPPPSAETDGDDADDAPKPVEPYKLGDFSRGLIGSIREKREQKKLSSPDKTGSYLQENKGRFAGVAGGTAGAAAGMLIAGPVGALAGSVFGSMGGQVAATQTSTDGESPANEGKARFRFGDNFRSVVARGKEATGRGSNDGYKLGDISRGLFGSRGGTTTDDEENK